jgi:hypothetical protein
MERRSARSSASRRDHAVRNLVDYAFARALEILSARCRIEFVAYLHLPLLGSAETLCVRNGAAVNRSDALAQNTQSSALYLLHGASERRPTTEPRVPPRAHERQRQLLIGAAHLQSHGVPGFAKRGDLLRSHAVKLTPIPSARVGAGRDHACHPMRDDLRNRKRELRRLSGYAFGSSAD